MKTISELKEEISSEDFKHLKEELSKFPIQGEVGIRMDLPIDGSLPLNLTKLNELINIRQYVVNSTGNSSIDKATVNYMNNLLIMIDKKIISFLKTDSFKEYVNYKDVKKSVEEVVRITNIKSGLPKNS